MARVFLQVHIGLSDVSDAKRPPPELGSLSSQRLLVRALVSSVIRPLLRSLGRRDDESCHPGVFAVRVLSLLAATCLLLASCGGPADETAEVVETPATPQVTEPITTLSPSASTVLSVESTSTTATTVAPSTTVSTTTTAPPATTTSTLPSLASLAAGLFCRDLAAMGYDYTAAVSYWTSEGSPDRMDADRNGIPCETVYPHSAVAALWGDPLPTTTAAGVTVWYTAGQPEYGTYQVAPLPGSGGLFGSGCSLGSDIPISWPCGETYCPIWLYVNDGRVTEIVELWFA